MKTILTALAALAMLSSAALADCVPLTANYVGAPALQCVGSDGGNGQPAFNLAAQKAKDAFKDNLYSK